MNFDFHLALAAIYLSSSFVCAQEAPKLPPEVALIKQHYAKDVEAAVKPIHDRYLEELRSSLRSANLKGELVVAQAIQAELTELLTRDGVVGKWRLSWEGGSKELDLRSNGEMIEAHNQVAGYWVLSKDKLLLEYTSGHTDMGLPRFSGRKNGTVFG